MLAATNRDLGAMVRQGLFREDLFYRLSTISLHVPPLRERAGDVELLVQYFVGQLNERFGCRKEVGDAALEVLRRHDWPGNVRELKHVVEAALVVCDGPEVRPEHLPASVRRTRVPAPAEAAAGRSRDLPDARGPRARSHPPGARRRAAATAARRPRRSASARGTSTGSSENTAG